MTTKKHRLNKWGPPVDAALERHHRLQNLNMAMEYKYAYETAVRRNRKLRDAIKQATELLEGVE